MSDDDLAVLTGRPPACPRYAYELRGLGSASACPECGFSFGEGGMVLQVCRRLETGLSFSQISLASALLALMVLVALLGWGDWVRALRGTPHLIFVSGVGLMLAGACAHFARRVAPSRERLRIFDANMLLRADENGLSVWHQLSYAGHRATRSFVPIAHCTSFRMLRVDEGLYSLQLILEQDDPRFRSEIFIQCSPRQAVALCAMLCAQTGAAALKPSREPLMNRCTSLVLAIATTRRPRRLRVRRDTT